VGQQRLHDTKRNGTTDHCTVLQKLNMPTLNKQMIADTLGNTSCIELTCAATRNLLTVTPTGPRHRPHDVNEEGQRIQVEISSRALHIHVIRVTAHC
jgi:hypothetical protein